MRNPIYPTKIILLTCVFAGMATLLLTFQHLGNGIGKTTSTNQPSRSATLLDNHIASPATPAIINSTDEFCEPVPCWNGLIPGKSTVADARTVLGTLGLLGYSPNDEPKSTDRSGTFVWRSGATHSGMSQNWMSIKEGLVQEIVLAFSPTYLTLQAVIDKVGPPNYIGTVSSASGTRFVLIYPSKGLECWTSFSYTSEPEGAANMIGWHYYSPVSSISEVTQKSGGAIYRPWSGFKK